MDDLGARRPSGLLRSYNLLHQALPLHSLLPTLQPQQDDALPHLLWRGLQHRLLSHLYLLLHLLLHKHDRNGNSKVRPGPETI